MTSSGRIDLDRVYNFENILPEPQIYRRSEPKYKSKNKLKRLFSSAMKYLKGKTKQDLTKNENKVNENNMTNFLTMIEIRSERK